MRFFNILKNDYIRLLIRRESRVVLGHRKSTLWLLTIVLTITFLAIAFSNASIGYLSYKMDDPFINWIDIKNENETNNFNECVEDLEREENRKKYHYLGSEYAYYYSLMFYGSENINYRNLRCRFFENINSKLVAAILSEDNVVNNWCVADISSIDHNSVGIIITEESMQKLGYETAPSYIDLQVAAADASQYGFEVYNHQGFSSVRVPIPVLAVVKNLPGNLDAVSTAYMLEQRMNNVTHPFSLYANPEYAEKLCYFLPSTINKNRFYRTIESIATEYSVDLEYGDREFWPAEVKTFREGHYITIYNLYDDIGYQRWADIHKRIISEYGDEGLYRIYQYDFSDDRIPYKSYMSIHFKDLDKLRDFDIYLSNNYDVNIDMTQINTKENFNAVSAMGNILSSLIIVFAIVCIVLFIINLLKSYFQKIKRNLGTFKAFGISNHDLISVYVFIMTSIVIISIVISLSAVWLLQGLLHLCDILKDGQFDYLALWNMMTVCSILVIITAAIFTVYMVMKRLLKDTPGDIIYDRQ